MQDFVGPPTYIVYLTCAIAVLYRFVFNVKSDKIKGSLIKLQLNAWANLAYIKKWSKYFYKSWLCLIVIDFFYAGGFPLLKVLQGDASGYNDIGIPSIKGLTHTLFYLNSVLFFCEIFFGLKKIKDFKLRFLLILVYPFLMLSRALLVGMILQVLFCYLYPRKIYFTSVVKIIVYFIGFVLAFGIVGDYRGEYENPFSYLIDPDFDVLNQLPSGVTWLYIYITANFNNILLSYGTFTPDGSCREIFYNLIPGALKSLFFNGKTTDFSPILLDENLNVASMYVGYVSGFDVVGAIIGGAGFLFVGNLFGFFLIKMPNIGMLIANSVYFSCVVESIFFDSFLTVSTFTQLFISTLISWNLSRKKRVHNIS